MSAKLSKWLLEDINLENIVDNEDNFISPVAPVAPVLDALVLEDQRILRCLELEAIGILLECEI